MDAGSLLVLLTGISIAVILLVIGIVQCCSKQPVGFYTGEKKFAASQLSNVGAWNRSHGIMWVVYSLITAAGFIAGMMMTETILCLIPIVCAILLPLPILILIHHCLVKKYKIC